MKAIEGLKQEQHDLKAKLHEIVDFINSEEYFTLTPKEKSLIGQQRVGMEVYLNALTNRIYCEDSFSFDAGATVWPMLLGSMFSSSSWGSSSYQGSEYLKQKLEESDFEEKEDE